MSLLHIEVTLSLSAMLFLFLSIILSSIPCSTARLLQNPGNVMNLIQNDPELAFISVLLEIAELDDAIVNGDVSETQLTIFGPINNAFRSVSEELLTYLLTDDQWNTHLMSLLGYHIVADQVVLDLDETAENIFGKELTLTISSSDSSVMINGYAKILNSAETKDGAVYAIDSLLDPGWLNRNLRGVLEAESSRLSTLSSMITRVDTMSNLATSSAPYTLFAPTNSAFSNSDLDFVNNLDPSFIDDVLGYHLVPGIYSAEDLTMLGVQPLITMSGETLVVTSDPALQITSVNGHLVIASDLLANNGVVHIVDGVLSNQPPVEIDPKDAESCEFEKYMEESIGATMGVQCNCQIIGNTVQLSCNEGAGQRCVPKFGICNSDVDGQRCCSPTQRRCVQGQCRDSRQPERVRIGTNAGGAAGRLQRDRNNKNDERTSVP
ncbi:fasciclin domain containing protein [Nitzschia inconspicua]|uniref:Fasciclin domain containing protein n=1 Tax=Nitzschia inconspicua TaxID=303405 RepID=A0A9K3KQW5_9STRA|nr:fasciclin domain containing protein [Nitzschia inconspicua]